MTIKITHSTSPRPNSKGFWNWVAWLEGSASEMDRIEKVNYKLHKSYPRSNRISRSRASGFRISSYGWGEFRLIATVYNKDGTKQPLDQWISFRTKETEETNRYKRVYLSHSAADSRAANESRNALEEAGVTVSMPDDLKPGIPWETALRDEIRDSDAMIVLVPEIESAFLEVEVSIARENNKKIIPFSFQYRQGETLEELAGLHEFHIKDVSEIAAALGIQETD